MIDAVAPAAALAGTSDITVVTDDADVYEERPLRHRYQLTRKSRELWPASERSFDARLRRGRVVHGR